MKSLLLVACSFLSISAFCQTPITLSRTDFPKPTSGSTLPDSVLYTNVPIAGNTVDIATTGASSTWNMVPLVNGTTAYQNFIPMSATPLVFQLVFISCDYAQPLLGNAGLVGNLPLSDAYEYYNYSTGNTQLEIKGFGANVSIATTGVPLPAVYSSPDVIYKFPVTFGNVDSSNSGFDVTLPLGAPIGDITIKRQQKRVNEVDGWGSITTPAGTFDVLRVKSSIDRMDSIITTLAPLGIPSKPVEIKWLGKTKKVPVFQVNANDLAGTVTPTSITFWGQGPSGIGELTQKSSIAVYPNPTIDNTTVEYTLQSKSDVAIYITNIKGETVGQFHFKNQSSGTHSEVLPTASMATGTYFIKCIAENQVVSSKLMKY